MSISDDDGDHGHSLLLTVIMWDKSNLSGHLGSEYHHHYSTNHKSRHVSPPHDHPFATTPGQTTWAARSLVLYGVGAGLAGSRLPSLDPNLGNKDQLTKLWSMQYGQGALAAVMRMQMCASSASGPFDKLLLAEMRLLIDQMLEN